MPDGRDSKQDQAKQTQDLVAQDALIAWNARANARLAAELAKSDAELGCAAFRRLAVAVNSHVNDRVEWATGVRPPAPAERLRRITWPRDPNADQSTKEMWAKLDNCDILVILIKLYAYASDTRYYYTGRHLPIPRGLWFFRTDLPPEE